MKDFFNALIASLTVLIGAVLLLAVGLGIAKADEKDNPKKDNPEIVQDYVQCTYKPSASDEVIKYCGTLKGSGSVSIRICGVNYTVDIICV